MDIIEKYDLFYNIQQKTLRKYLLSGGEGVNRKNLVF